MVYTVGTAHNGEIVEVEEKLNREEALEWVESRNPNFEVFVVPHELNLEDLHK